MFLLVPAHPGSPRQKAVKQLLLLLSRSCVFCVTLCVADHLLPSTTGDKHRYIIMYLNSVVCSRVPTASLTGGLVVVAVSAYWSVVVEKLVEMSWSAC